MPDLRHQGDARNLRPIAGAPTSASVRSVRDVLLVLPNHNAAHDDFEAHPPVGSPAFDLGGGLRLEHLDSDLADLVMNACTPRGHYWFGVRQFGSLFAFVREIPDPETARWEWTWDTDNEIWFAIVLSRLVRDNGYSTEFAARVVEHEDGEYQVIPVNAPASVATFRLKPAERDWLTVEEAGELRDLVQALRDRGWELPERVIRAVNRAEDAVISRYLQQQVIMIGVGLEALVNTDRQKANRQFKIRVSALSELVGGGVMTRSQAAKLYDARSEAAHDDQVRVFSPRVGQGAGGVEAPMGGDPAGVQLLQDGLRILRGTIRKSIVEPAFARVFTDGASIDAYFQAVDEADGAAEPALE